MDIFKLLDEIEDIVESGSSIPFASKVLVDKNELLEIITEIRVKLPDELKQAEWIKEERQRILAEAQSDADTMVKEVQLHIEEMVDRHEIVSQAQDRAQEIMAKAQSNAKEIRIGANEYADDILKNMENNLRELEGRIKDTIDVLEINRSELSENR
ncbi:hypothetical protein Curi_c16610 [Gottschalkia acidurici 9a]|uniref:ATPase n=1 Tax=Gottschalkia acidurici (strain ATCC 7906 / DSM 604 / BCRC 14475 / CIP 104303 / KCTC 5404 / NCIMB 10678 / 9a) TaxID=1128398 RepID=K0AXZ0_GOTA9|nr:hypothetical protein [Gottschalkia acidurici]AFS78668.1 hypothetical protein Curi_c16610 [Gottschalkia acidurici 9a]